MISGSGLTQGMSKLLTETAKDPSMVLKDHSLHRRGIDPDRLRRWFQTTHGMTFQDYLRLQRIITLCGRMHHRVSPAPQTGEDEVVVTRLSTPLGPMLAGASRAGVCLLEFMDRRMLETQLRRLNRYFGPGLDAGASEYFGVLNAQLEEYFAGARMTFSVPLDVPGTPFQNRAWEALMTIPYGETRSYQDQAAAIGQPTAVRAVARANGDNRVSIVIPCHRVIGKDGSLTGYGGKLWRKRKLLDLEAEVAGSGQGRLFEVDQARGGSNR